MKTIADLNTLIHIICDLVKNNDHEIGEAYIEQDEDGYNVIQEPISNYFTFEKNGWQIDICYDCCGNWDYEDRDVNGASGKVTEISAYYKDSELSEKELNKLESAINTVLERI